MKQVKSQIKEDMDNIFDQTKNTESLNLEIVLTTQYFGTPH